MSHFTQLFLAGACKYSEEVCRGIFLTLAQTRRNQESYQEERSVTLTPTRPRLRKVEPRTCCTVFIFFFDGTVYRDVDEWA